MDCFLKNPLFNEGRLPEVSKVIPLEYKLPNISPEAMSWLKVIKNNFPTNNIFLKKRFA